jgi:two-component system phosphate regulon sensor histidine kinase PhoR
LRRGVVILVLCLCFLAGGTCGLLFGSSQRIPGVANLPFNQIVGMSLFYLAGCVGMLGMLSMHRSTRKLTETLVKTDRNARPTEEGAFAKIGCPHPDLYALVDAFNALVEHAERSIARAELRVKELDIQLRVATAERQHAEAIIYSISDAVLVTDVFDELVLANDTAARAFNFDISGSTRFPIAQVIDDPKMVSLIKEMRQSDSKSGRRIVEHRVKGPTGERTFKVTLSNVASRDEKPAGVVCVLHDMTKEKEVAEMKNDFVSNVSHELRTPLASIKAYVEMLIDGEAADEKTQREFYDVIHNEANRLGRLIDNILNISRIESGLVKTNRKPQSLMVILKEAVEVISPQAKQKQIAIEEQIAPAFYQTMCDRDMLYEAILNLLSNAVKYTPEGGKIIVQSDVDESRRKVTARICDTGVGIPAKDLPFVFDKFYRSEANSRMAKGTGLGLSLVKHIIEVVHRGRLFVQSEQGKGSTFGFELDLIE